MRATKIVELIYTQGKAGDGTDEDPFRLLDQLWTKDGTLIAEYDPYDKSFFTGMAWLKGGD